MLGAVRRTADSVREAAQAVREGFNAGREAGAGVRDAVAGAADEIDRTMRRPKVGEPAILVGGSIGTITSANGECTEAGGGSGERHGWTAIGWSTPRWDRQQGAWTLGELVTMEREAQQAQDQITEMLAENKRQSHDLEHARVRIGELERRLIERGTVERVHVTREAFLRSYLRVSTEWLRFADAQCATCDATLLEHAHKPEGKKVCGAFVPSQAAVASLASVITRHAPETVPVVGVVGAWTVAFDRAAQTVNAFASVPCVGCLHHAMQHDLEHGACTGRLVAQGGEYAKGGCDCRSFEPMTAGSLGDQLVVQGNVALDAAQ